MNRSLHRHTLPVMTTGLLLTALPLFAQTPTTLRMKYKQGEVSQYQTSMSVLMAGMNAPTSGGAPAGQQFAVLQEFKTSKTLPGGSAQVLVTTKNMQGGMGMGTTALPKPVTLTMDSLGSVKATSGSMGGNVPNMFSNMLGSNALGTQQIPLPTQPVKPGSTWTNSFNMPGMGAGNVKGQYVKVNMVGKQKTALLHYILTIPMKVMLNSNNQPTQVAASSIMTMSGTVIMNVDNDIDMVTGRLIRSAGTGSMTMTITPKNPPKQAPKGGAAPMNSMNIKTNITLGTTLVSYTAPAGGAAAVTPPKPNTATAKPTGAAGAH